MLLYCLVLICASLYCWSKKISAFFSSLCVFVCVEERSQCKVILSVCIEGDVSDGSGE